MILEILIVFPPTHRVHSHALEKHVLRSNKREGWFRHSLGIPPKIRVLNFPSNGFCHVKMTAVYFLCWKYFSWRRNNADSKSAFGFSGLHCGTAWRSLNRRNFCYLLSELRHYHVVVPYWYTISFLHLL